MTSLPSSKNLRANARPIPAEPPVMSIVRPLRFKGCLRSSCPWFLILRRRDDPDFIAPSAASYWPARAPTFLGRRPAAGDAVTAFTCDKGAPRSRCEKTSRGGTCHHGEPLRGATVIL